MHPTQTLRRGVVAALFSLAVAAPAFAAGGIEASDAWIRWLPAGLPAGGYVTLHNNGDHPVDLVGAQSADYASVMLHESVRHGDRMEMKGVRRVVIPAHGKVEFKPGSYHIMLMKPSRELKPGDHVPIDLHFSGGATEHVEFEVRKADAEGPGMDMKGMDMKGMDMKGMDMKGMDMKGMGGDAGQH